MIVIYKSNFVRLYLSLLNSYALTSEDAQTVVRSWWACVLPIGAISILFLEFVLICCRHNDGLKAYWRHIRNGEIQEDVDTDC